MEKYKDKSLEVDQRVEDLLGRMTLKEKVGQLNQKMSGWDAYRKIGSRFELSAKFKELVSAYDGMGALYGLFRADPWSRVTFENGITPKDSAKVANMVQKYVIENTRLGIPVLISEECPHGHQALDGTMFPTNIGMGSTWNPELYRKAMGVAAAEIRSRGAHLGLVSSLDMLRDPRWGRSEECYSEDPYLASRMAEVATRGLQGIERKELKGNSKIIAVLKHFCAQGAGAGGHNAAPTFIGERELREIHLKSMSAGVKAGALACMAAYNEIDGIKCHANEQLLTKILREEMGFEGIVMADGGALNHLIRQTGDNESAAALGLKAGVDLSLWDDVYTKIEGAVRQGKISIEYVDRAVERILQIKFLLGLFDNPYTDEKLAVRVVANNESKKINLEAAMECPVLLKNEGGLLPLDRNSIGSIAVIGPNADNIYNQLGDYTSSQREGTGYTVLQGIKEIAAKGTKVFYAKGCRIRGSSKEGFAEAVSLAKKADVTVLVLGGSSARNFNIRFDSNGAAIVSDDDKDSEMNCGEGVDVSSLELHGVQEELAKKIISTGKPVVVVLIQGRPHAIPWMAENCKAILCAWYPGKEGGKAIAEILFGIVNPSGKLPVSIPKSTGQIPVYYNHKDNMAGSYADIDGLPQYPFGHGLSYTTFKYKNLKIKGGGTRTKDIENGCKIEISIEVENIGKMEGKEVVQIYVYDMEASIRSRVKELKGFEKISLKPGKCRNLKFYLGKDELSVWDSKMRFTVEPGNFKVMAGGSSTACLVKTFKLA